MTAARVRIGLWLGMLLAVAWLAWQARWALLPFSAGALLAYVLTPAVDRVAGLLPAHTHRQNVYRRGVAVLFVYLLIGLALLAAGVLVVPVAADQIAQFVEGLPQLIDDTQAQFGVWLEVYRERVPDDVRERIDRFVADFGDDIGARVAGSTTGILSSLTTAIALLAGFVLVPIWMFYALRDRHNFERNFSAALPAAVRADVLNAVRIADLLMGSYLRGQLFLGLIVGVATFAGLTLIGVDLAIALAVFAGIAELIPIIGPWIGALPAVMIVAATDPGKIVWVVLLYLGVQQIENNLLVPRVQGHAVQVHPAVIMMLLAIAGAVFGLVGLIVVVPLAALLRELFWYADHRLSGLVPAQAMARTHVAGRPPTPPEASPPPDAEPDAGDASEAVDAAGAPDAGGAPAADASPARADGA